MFSFNKNNNIEINKEENEVEKNNQKVNEPKELEKKLSPVKGEKINFDKFEKIITCIEERIKETNQVLEINQEIYGDSYETLQTKEMNEKTLENINEVTQKISTIERAEFESESSKRISTLHSQQGRKKKSISFVNENKEKDIKPKKPFEIKINLNQGEKYSEIFMKQKNMYKPENEKSREAKCNNDNIMMEIIKIKKRDTLQDVIYLNQEISLLEKENYNTILKEKKINGIKASNENNQTVRKNKKNSAPPMKQVKVEIL